MHKFGIPFLFLIFADESSPATSPMREWIPALNTAIVATGQISTHAFRPSLVKVSPTKKFSDIVYCPSEPFVVFIIVAEEKFAGVRRMHGGYPAIKGIYAALRTKVCLSCIRIE